MQASNHTTKEMSQFIVSLNKGSGQIHIPVKAVSLEDLFYNFITDTIDRNNGEYPTHITLPSGLRIPYIHYFFRGCFCKGILSEEELLSLSLNSNN